MLWLTKVIIHQYPHLLGDPTGIPVETNGKSGSKRKFKEITLDSVIDKLEKKTCTDNTEKKISGQSDYTKNGGITGWVFQVVLMRL